MVRIMYKCHLNDVEWGEFRLSSIFNIKDGYYNKKPPIEGGTIPFLSATQYNNGISAFYSEEMILSYDKVGEKTSKDIDKRIFDGNCLTITNNGSVGNVYYQTGQFTCSHDVTPIYLKNYKLNSSLAKFLIPMLEQSGKSFEYAKKWRPKRMRKSRLLLPIDKHGNPNWHFMEEYIKERENKQRSYLKEYYKNRLLDMVICPEVLKDVEWVEFRVKDLFDVKPVKGKSIGNHNKGSIPYVTTSAVNNGVGDFIDTSADASLKNCLSVDPIGGKVFYHEYEFVGRGGAGSAINLLYSDRLNREIGKFICSAMEKTSLGKASYAVALNGDRLRNAKLLLPIDKNGNPNWAYMENFIKNIEQKKIKEILKYLDQYI